MSVLVPLDRRTVLLSLLAACALVALWLPRVLVGHSVTIGQERYWFLRDDAMISMRYARNLARGYGLVWNPGERVEGFTNPLWTLYMALLHMLPIPLSKISLAVSLTSIALAVATIPLLVQFVGVLGGDLVAAVGALASYVLSTDILSWTTSGFETAFLMFFALLSAYRVVQESQVSQPRISTYLLIGIMPLIRADAIVLMALFLGISLLLSRDKRQTLTYSTMSLGPFIAYEAFRVCYYRDLLPNTAYLKAFGWDGRLAAGWAYLLSFSERYGVLVLFSVAGLVLSRRRLHFALVVSLLLYAIYVVYVGGDAFESFRFFVPVLPILFSLAYAGMTDLTPLPGLRLLVSVVCLSTLPVIVPSYRDSVYPPYYGSHVENIRIAMILKDKAPVNSKVADFWAGIVPYFSDLYAIDLLGKSDAYVAQLPNVTEGGIPGHNKFDFDHSLGDLRPDFVVAAFRLPVGEDYMREVAQSNFEYAFKGQLYFHPLFQDQCLSNPVSLETWRTIFACDWVIDSERH